MEMKWLTRGIGHRYFLGEAGNVDVDFSLKPNLIV
jgi:hypothetical protein